MSNPSGSNWTTNVNRSKTKRWVEAKSYSYDGDDWGDVDEYGEYDEPQATAKPAGLRKATAPASTTGHMQSPIGENERTNSFTQEDERRAFSGPTRTAYAQPQPPRAQPGSSQQQQSSQSSQWPQNTSQLGNDLRSPTNIANPQYDGRTASMTSTNNAQGGISGRRKPSIGQVDPSASTMAPIATNIEPPPVIGAPEKPTTPTLIRPADIYRRMQEEREKERLSQESARPSLSGLTRDESPAGKSDKSGRQTQGSGPVLATPQPINPQTDILRSKGPSYSPQLPEISGLSGFGDDFGGSFLSAPAPPSQLSQVVSADAPESAATLSKSSDAAGSSASQNTKSSDSTLHHQPSLGYKSVVSQAFDQAVPPTPSTTSGSGVDRSNSDSTNNISPIISRETSSAIRPDGISNISSIIEEPNEMSVPGTPPKTVKRPGIDEPTTFIPGHRRDTSLPSANNSPARTPTVEASKQLAAAQEAEIAVTTPTSSTLPLRARDGSSSPTKNRVRNLVDKIDSNGAKGAQPSLADNVELQRPSATTNQSFRPNIPGSWTSYTTNPPPRQTTDSDIKPSEEPRIMISNDQPAETREDQFAKAAAAGSALAGALAAAAGLSAASDASSQSQDTETRKSASKIDTAFHPEAARLVLPRQDSDAPSSIVPTPLDMKPGSNQQSEYFSASATSVQKPIIPSGTSLHVPQAQDGQSADNLSTHSSPTDLESDRLRKEIVRELSPQRENVDKEQAEMQQPKPEGEASYSAIYDSYLEEDEAQQRETKAPEKVSDTPMAASQPRLYENPSPPMFSSTSGPLEDVPEGPSMSEASHSLKRQFSWETPLENLATGQTDVDHIDREASTSLYQDTMLREAESASAVVDSSNTGTPSRSHLDKPLPPPETSKMESTIPPSFEQTPPPPRIVTQTSNDPILPPQPQMKVPAFREIMAIQSTPQRIQVYDQTRDTFAKMDTGLWQWIQATITSLPEHEELLRNGGSFPPVLRAAPTVGVQGGQSTSSAPRPSYGPTSSKTVKGIFGGKAGGAAKGLFAKGRSKWGRSSDKASKRLRGRSNDANSGSPSKPFNQLENTWETDVSAPYFSSQTLSRQGTSQAPVTGLLDPSAVSQNNENDDVPPVTAVASTSVSPPTTAAQDSPTLGRSNTTTGASGVSPLSGRTSFEKKRASLAQKRASMEVPGSVKTRNHRHSSSVDSHRYGSRLHRDPEEKPVISMELQARLTVHQNQMRSFGEEFPADLIIPAEYRIPSDVEKTPQKPNDTSAEKTPTQADFPKEIVGDRTNTGTPLHTEEIKKAERKATPSALWLDTTGTTPNHTFDGPASPDYALRKEGEAAAAEIEKEETPQSDKRPGTHKHYSSFSFIQFDPMPSADLTLKNPITPRRQSFNRERSDTGASSQHETQASESSFADYPAAEDFGALPTDPSVTTPGDLEHAVSIDSQSLQDTGVPEQLAHQLSQGSEGTRSRSSMVILATKRMSKQPGDGALDSPTIPKQENHHMRDGVPRDLANSYKRHSMLSDVRESRELYPDGKDNRKQNRKSLLGLGLSMRPPTAESLPAKAAKGPKFSLIPSIRKRTDTDLSRYEADVSRPSLTTDRNPANVQRSAATVLDSDRRNLNSGAADNLGQYREKAKKRRFSGLSSFINKAKPRIAAVSNATRGRSPTPQGTVIDAKRDITPERRNVESFERTRQEKLGQVQQKASPSLHSANEGIDTRPTTNEGARASKDQLVVPTAQIRNAASIPDINSNQDAVINRITAPPQNGPDYKSVYPPEFFGEQPPQGYYGPEENPDIVVNATSEVKGTNAHPSQTGSSTEAQALPEAGKDQIRPNQVRPPPLSLNNGTRHPKPVAKPIAALSQESTKTTSDIGTPVSQLETDDSRSYAKNRATIADSIISSLDTPSLSSPIMHTATTRTLTRIANDRSISPDPRSENRSSLPMIPPLKIAKKSPVIDDERYDEDISFSSERYSPVAESPRPRNGTPQLIVNTRTGPVRPAPVEQLSSKSTASKELNALPLSSPPNRALPHPFIAKRTASSPAVPTNSTIKSQVLPRNENDSCSTLQADAVFEDNRPKTMNALDKRDTANDAIPAVMDDPVLTVRPLIIRKSPEIGTNKSPSLGTTKTPDLSIQNTVEPTDKSSSTKSSPLSPNRASLHSPALKDSPTLPRPTLSQFTILDEASNTTNGVIPETKPIPRSVPTKQPIKPKQATLDVEKPPPQTNGTTIKSSGTMTPVEKMKDEPRVKETVKDSDESEDEIVMSSTAYPGQEWRPDYGYGGWDGYE